MKKELYETLIEYNSTVTSFHMPGHKGKGFYPFPDSYAMDVTEVPGTDDLYHPEGILAQSMKQISDIYGTEESILLVNGSTAGVTAAITAIGKPGDTIAIARNCHKSVYNAALMNDYQVVYIEPQPTDIYGVFGSIDPNRVQEVLKKNNAIKAVVLTSPTYEGIVSDIAAISQMAHERECCVIVDEAHGAHFDYSELLPQSACRMGADIVIQSTHKTLPALTQTGLCHVMSWAYINKKRLIEALQMVQTSSPSYVLMASIDSAVRYMDRHRSSFTTFIQQLQTIISGEIQGGYFLGANKPIVYDQDPTRLTFIIEEAEITGYDLMGYLRAHDNIQAETAGMEHVIFIVTIADDIPKILTLMASIEKAINALMWMHSPTKNSEGDTVQRLTIESTINSSQETIQKKNMPIKDTVMAYPKTQAVMTMHEAYYSCTRMQPINETIGCVSASFLIPYPPGIPIVCPGEVISEDILNRIQEFHSNEWEVYGIIDSRIEVVDFK